MLTRVKPVPARLMAVLLGLALSGLVPIALPPAARGSGPVCRMACAGTARCCCRPPAGQRATALSASRAAGRPSLRAIAMTPACPQGCAALRVAPGGPGRPAPPDLAGAAPPAPAAFLSLPPAASPGLTRLVRITQPRAPPLSRIAA